MPARIINVCKGCINLGGGPCAPQCTRIKEPRYYSVSLDSTPDEGHVDQLTLMRIEAEILRVINFENLVTEFAKKKTCKVSLISHDSSPNTN